MPMAYINYLIYLLSYPILYVDLAATAAKPTLSGKPDFLMGFAAVWT